jgi:hypothetical protein
MRPSEFPPGPELTLLPMNRREFLANRVGRRGDGGAEPLPYEIELKKTWHVID